MARAKFGLKDRVKERRLAGKREVELDQKLNAIVSNSVQSVTPRVREIIENHRAAGLKTPQDA